MIGRKFYGQRCFWCLFTFVVYLVMFLIFVCPLQTVVEYSQPTPAMIREEDSVVKGLLPIPTLAEEHLPEGALLVLVLSSLPRSGSSLMGELLATIPNSVYYFEPIYKFNDYKTLLHDQYIITDYIKNLFTCKFEENFEDWFKTQFNWIKWWNEKSKKCKRYKYATPRMNCLRKLDIKQDCEDSKAVIMKVIRAKISWLEPLLINESLNFKVIHMVRDPRASMKSIMKFKGWNKDPNYRCSKLLEDMDAYKVIKDKYMDKIMRVTHEELSLEPFETVQRIFHFLYKNQTLPENTRLYISTHMSYHGAKVSGKKVAWSLYKDSAAQYQDWRWNISQKLLKQVEDEPTCSEAIKQLGYTIFGSRENVRNKSTPLIKQL